MVLTYQSLKSILWRPDISRCLAKWVVELREFDIEYKSRPSMKAQVLTDFIVKCMILNKEKEVKREVLKKVLTTPSWMLHVDGASSA